jgi:hypothetical protein
MKKIIILIFVTALSLSASNASAAVSSGTGTLYPTTAPGETMYSIEEIYNLLLNSTKVEVGSGDFNSPIEKSDGTISLKDLYNAALTLRNLVDEEDDDDTDEDENTVTPDNSELFTEVSTMRVLDTYTAGRYGFIFNATASNVPLYIPKNLNLEYITLGGTPVSEMVQVISSTVTSSIESEGEYYKLNPKQSGEFAFRIKVENLGGPTNIENMKLALTGIEYKNSTTTSEMKVFIPEANSFTISEISLKNN